MAITWALTYSKEWQLTMINKDKMEAALSSEHHSHFQLPLSFYADDYLQSGKKQDLRNSNSKSTKQSYQFIFFINHNQWLNGYTNP